MSRHNNTIEHFGVVVEVTSDSVGYVLAQQLWEQRTSTKYLTPVVLAEYLAAFKAQEADVVEELSRDRDTRRAVVMGPTSRPLSCWRSLQLLSNKDGTTYTAIAHFRSMDSEHVYEDSSLMWRMAEELVGQKISKLVIIINSFHTYIKEE